MKPFFAAILIAFTIPSAFSQEVIATKYFDSSGINPLVSLQPAAYYCTYKPSNGLFLEECFWQSTRKHKSITMISKSPLSAEFLYAKNIGKTISYYENDSLEREAEYDAEGKIIYLYKYYKTGKLSDSIFYNVGGHIDSAFHYYENGKIRAIFHRVNKKEILQAYDESGNPREQNIVYMKEAGYGESKADWSYFVRKNLDPNVPVDKKAKPGTYTVIVKFKVDTDGNVSDIKAETKHGYGMEEEVLRMMRKSGKWSPAIFLGEKIAAYRRQPVTFVVMAD